MTAVVLASASPRRRALLEQLGLDVVVRPADADESVRRGEPAVAYVERLARDKALAVAAGPGEIVIAADTTVEIDGEIIGKPGDAAHARAMLARLSGRSHRVHTGVAVRAGERLASAVATTVVVFCELSEANIDWYLATGEPFDKAGGYGIQGAAGAFVESVSGSVSNVVGLPLTLTVALARALGTELLAS